MTSKNKANLHISSYDAAYEKKTNIVGQKIAMARKKNGMSQQAFKEYLELFGVNVSKAAESQWETGRTVPNAYQLMAVCAALDIDDMRYFTEGYVPVLNEEGERKVAEYREDLAASGKYRPLQKHRTEIRYIEMPVSNLMVSAGTGSFLDEGNFDMISFPENTVPVGAEFGVRVSGDSMEPVYHDGQIVWVKPCQQLNIGDVGIFTLDGCGYIKSYDEQEPDEMLAEDFTDTYGMVHMQPVLISYNQAYEPKPILPTSEFRMIGRVL